MLASHLAVVSAVVALLTQAGCSRREPGLLVFKNVNVVNVEQGTVDSFMLVVIRNGVIEMVGTAATVTIPAGAETIDGTGLYLMPGLWDMQVRARPADWPRLVSWGVLGILDVGGSPPAVSDSVTAPRIVAAGPATRRVVYHLDFMPEQCRGLFQPSGVDGEFHVPLPPDCDDEHLDSLVASLARRGTWLAPAISSFRIGVTLSHYQVLYAGFRSLVPRIRRHAIPLLAGTGMGDDRVPPGESLHDELALLVDAGFTPAEALRAAVTNPVRLLGLADSLGGVAPGQAAELVLIESNPLVDIRSTRRIRLVVHRGQVLPPGDN